MSALPDYLIACLLCTAGGALTGLCVGIKLATWARRKDQEAARRHRPPVTLDISALPDSFWNPPEPPRPPHPNIF